MSDAVSVLSMCTCADCAQYDMVAIGHDMLMYCCLVEHVTFWVLSMGQLPFNSMGQHYFGSC